MPKYKFKSTTPQVPKPICVLSRGSMRIQIVDENEIEQQIAYQRSELDRIFSENKQIVKRITKKTIINSPKTNSREAKKASKKSYRPKEKKNFTIINPNKSE